jgi:hypothetical protein
MPSRTLRAALVSMLATLSLWSSAWAGAELERSPFKSVAAELLERLHAQVVPCDVALDPSATCFVVTPATVASIAEVIEALLEESAGALERTAWRSANGVHRLELVFPDEVWGALELWFSEPGEAVVAGMLGYVTRRRGDGP